MANTEHDNNGNEPTPANHPDIELRIVTNETGKIEVTGPLHNKPFCYGLLESAKDIVREIKPVKQKKSNLILPGDGPERARSLKNFLRGK